jgi:hypothetical protein
VQKVKVQKDKLPLLPMHRVGGQIIEALLRHGIGDWGFKGSPKRKNQTKNQALKVEGLRI